VTTAFVLGGARNLGAMQVGMLAALLDAGIRPDLVVGCSVGAINGAAVAADPTPAGVEHLEAVWGELRRGDIWPSHPAAAAVRMMRRDAVGRGNEGLRAVVERHLPATFDELALPFACVAASLSTGQARWFSSGPLADAVLASSALPGLLPPVSVDGEALIDGAAVDVVPVERAIGMGADRLFVLQIKDLEASPAPPRRPLDVLVRAFAISRNARFLASLAAVPPTVEVHVLPVVEWPRLRYDGFSRTPELVAAARTAAAGWLRERGLA
jgi:NTE family protein